MIEEELLRISNMDLQQLLLKVRNIKYWPEIHTRNQLKQAINNKLNSYGYKLVSKCCGQYTAEIL